MTAEITVAGAKSKGEDAFMDAFTASDLKAENCTAAVCRVRMAEEGGTWECVVVIGRAESRARMIARDLRGAFLMGVAEGCATAGIPPPSVDAIRDQSLLEIPFGIAL